MNKKTYQLITYLILGLAFNSQAQNYSSTYYSDGGDATSGHLLLDSVMYMFTTATSTQFNGKFNNSIYWKINRDGTIMDSSVYTYDTIPLITSYRHNLIYLGEDKLLFAQNFRSTPDTVFTNLIEVNLNLDTLNNTHYIFTDSLQEYATFTLDLQKKDSVFILLGVYKSDNKLNLFLASFDSTYQLLWQKAIVDFRTYSAPSLHGLTSQRLVFDDNSYYITGYAKYPNQYVEDFLIKTDLQGNLIWDKRYRYEGKNTGGHDMFISNDTLFKSVGYLSFTSGWNNYIKWQFIQLDTAGNVLMDTVYPDEEIIYQIESMRPSKDGNILLAGSYYWAGQKSFIWKMDKNFNTIWRKAYHHGDYEDESYLFNIMEWPDGGVLAAGTYSDSYLNPSNKVLYAWLLSTDANGCLSSTNCGSDISVEDWPVVSKNAWFYPNPAKDFLAVQMPPGSGTAQLQLHNVQGQLVFESYIQNQEQVKLPSLVAGLYTATLVIGKERHVEKLVIQP